MVDYYAIGERREAWDTSHPFFADAGNSRNLHERLKLYLRTVKHEEDDSTATIRKLENLDGVVAEVAREIRKRSIEDDAIEEERPDEQKERFKKAKIVKQELQKTIDRRPDTLILISKEDLESEAEIAGNPARAYENTSAQELLRTANKELKQVLQRSSRPKIEEDVVSEEIDNPAEEGDPDDEDVFQKTTGKPMVSPTKAMSDLNEEMQKACERLLPADNYILAEKIKKRMKN